MEIFRSACKVNTSKCFLQWMYLVPLGLIVMNAVTQAMNMPEEQAAGQAPQRISNSGARRR